MARVRAPRPSLMTAALAALALIGWAPARAATDQAVGYFEATATSARPRSPARRPTTPATQTYTLTGAGTNMWAARDEFQFAWRKMTGDFILPHAREFVGRGRRPAPQAGIDHPHEPRRRRRPTSTPPLHGDGLTSLQFRAVTGGPTEQVPSAVVARRRAPARARREDVHHVGRAVRRAVHAHRADRSRSRRRGLRRPVRLLAQPRGLGARRLQQRAHRRAPARRAGRPYRDYIGSNLEVMTIERRPHRWCCTPRPDLDPGAELDARRQGADLQQQTASCIGSTSRRSTPTRASTPARPRATTTTTCCRSTARCSASATTAPATTDSSVVYTLPATGGDAEAHHREARRRTSTAGRPTRSGWSTPAQRNDEFDIYRISGGRRRGDPADDRQGWTTARSSRRTGSGSTSTPTRTGRMQIWRMKPDGSEQQQITSDEFNNWFPHISPDGKSMVVLSFLGDDVESGRSPVLQARLHAPR